MITRIRIVEDETTRFFRRINLWLKVEKNVDQLIVWFIPAIVAMVVAVVLIKLFFFGG